MRTTILALLVAATATAVPAQEAPPDTAAIPPSDPEPADVPAGPAVVHRIVVDGAISPASAEYIADAIETARADRAQALVIELDTPGGLVESTRDIVQSMMASGVPVVVYVAPGGARAGSAGVFLTLAAHVAAMAPGTNIGAATPITMGGDEAMPGGRPSPPDSIEQTQPDGGQKALDQKVLNDTIAFIRTIAEKRGRNADWAERAVTEAASITETEAVDQNVVDLVARSTGELLDEIDGREVEVVDRTVTLDTAGADVVTQEKGLRFRILDTIANPNIAFLLMMIGIWGIFFELMNPGAILPGVVGGISLLLAFFALQALPVNYVGVMLILFSLVLFIAEVKVISHGLLTVGGTIAFVLGATMLFEGPGSLFSVSWSVIVPVAILTVAFFVFAMRLAYTTWKSQPTTGREGLVGERGVVRRRIDPLGKVAVHGEIWTARAAEPIETGTSVEVVGAEGLTVEVRPVDALADEERRVD
ncbi:MAG: nodulation protein NfeD [Gemmatimonadota bacterium]|nr:nodulation protein NfeD [Gemmatimonadota bacterium]